MAAQGIRLIGVVRPRMMIETRVGRDNSLLVRNSGNQAEALEIRIEGGQGRSPAFSRIWRVSARQLASTYVLPVSVAPGSRVVLSAP